MYLIIAVGSYCAAGCGETVDRLGILELESEYDRDDEKCDDKAICPQKREQSAARRSSVIFPQCVHSMGRASAESVTVLCISFIDFSCAMVIILVSLRRRPLRGSVRAGGFFFMRLNKRANVVEVRYRDIGSFQQYGAFFFRVRRNDCLKFLPFIQKLHRAGIVSIARNEYCSFDI